MGMCSLKSRSRIHENDFPKMIPLVRVRERRTQSLLYRNRSFHFQHALINRLLCLTAVWALRQDLNPFHGVLRLVGIGLGGIGTCDRGLFRTVG